jgi:excisionase family DNA binding protein
MPSRDDTLEHALAVEEVAETIKSSKGFVFGQINSGRLRAIRVGPKFLRVLPEDLRAWLDVHATAGKGG